MKRPPFSRAWLKERAAWLKGQTYALYFAFRNPRTPWYAKAFTGLLVAYAFSPIDLIPDFIPVLGYLDDLLILPLGAWLALKLIPADVMAEARAQAEAQLNDPRPVSKVAAVAIVLIWLAAIGLCAWWVYRALEK